MKEKDFVAFLTEAGRYDKTAEKCTVCGIILPSFSDYLLRGPAGALGTKYNVLSYNEQGLTVIPINNITGNMLPDESAFIPGEKITSMKTVPKLTYHRLYVGTSDGTAVFRLNKVLIGYGWHKRNLPSFIATVNGLEEPVHI
ncbi:MULTISPECIES: hypothetical protein [Heyndrickxia]|uniref:hypothetical protein n=1 Tax=Heyndrickxia TaxID=2837504 RepID=UPI002E242D20|nr:hypothetical protein [Weizmannia sp. CD-2023]